MRPLPAPRRKPARTILLLAVLLAGWATHASTQETATLTVFCRGGSRQGSAIVGVVQGSDGNFYANTAGRDNVTDAFVFRLAPDGTSRGLREFTPISGLGTNLSTALVQGSDGNFYGTATGGGRYSHGTAFKITPTGEATPLYSFYGGWDGGFPGALTQGSDGNFYGTTSGEGVTASASSGGTPNGTVFMMEPTGAIRPLHAFNDRPDGAHPKGTLVEGKAGDFYGTTFDGGDGGYGAVFRVNPWGRYEILHSFDGGTDGRNPSTGLVLGDDGNFYGTTLYTGTTNGGTVFRMTPEGVLTTLHNFSPDGTDGFYPTTALVKGRDGNFYGTTQYGGSKRGGTVFRLSPDGASYTILYEFDGYTDSHGPKGTLLLASDGNLYGTDATDIYKLFVPGLHPAFFAGEKALGSGVSYLDFSGGHPFGYYSFLQDQNYLYHFDLGYEYVFDAYDGKAGVYLYDFTSGSFFYTSPSFPFPYLYDFTLNTVLYYYPDPNNPGHYNTGGTRFFYRFDNGQIIVK